MAEPTTLAVNPELEAQVFSQTLGETPLRLRVFWNRRAQSYWIDFRDVEGKPLLMGVKVVVEWNLWDGYEIEGLPDGRLIVSDTSNEDKPPGKYEFGQDARVKPIFLPGGGR